MSAVLPPTLPIKLPHGARGIRAFVQAVFRNWPFAVHCSLAVNFHFVGNAAPASSFSSTVMRSSLGPATCSTTMVHSPSALAGTLARLMVLHEGFVIFAPDLSPDPLERRRVDALQSLPGLLRNLQDRFTGRG